ncbi:MAG: response regulator transcription factor [Saprospiraceae bacterium]|nr:response regulator transcription factor [Saprospiraceae bacterium]
MKKHKIVIVDDHLLFSNSLKKLIEGFADYEVTKQMSNGRELIAYLGKESSPPDLVLLDVKMPVMDGKETMEYISIHFPNVNVLVLSMDDDEATIIYMLRKGAKGYILKDIDPEKFKEAVENVLHRGFYHSERVSAVLLGEINKGANEAQLSDRELVFLDLVCSDKTYKEIAGEMYLSPKTIDGYRANLFKKLNVKSRVGLAMYAIKNGLVNI